MIRRLLAAAFTVALSACGAVKATYNNLDWILDWQIGHYVGLDPSQKALLDDRFREFWKWHRGTQLTLYVRDLRELADQAAAPMSAAQVQDYLDRSTAHLARAMQELTPPTAKLLASLDDAQIEQIGATLEKRREKTRAEVESLSDDELKDKTERDMDKQLKRWIGPLDAAQKARVRRWAIERRYAGTVWMQYQQAWGFAFANALKHRHEPDFEQRIGALLNTAKNPARADLRALQAENREHWIALMSDLSASLSDRQRQFFRRALLDFAADLQTLASQG